MLPAPFELTKNAMVLSNQIKDNTAVSKEFRDSYAGKGTYATAKTIVKNCGWPSLYCGLQLQLGTFLFASSPHYLHS